MSTKQLAQYIKAIVKISHECGVPNDVLSAKASSAIAGGAALAYVALAAAGDGASRDDQLELFASAGLELSKAALDTLDAFREAIANDTIGLAEPEPTE